MLTDRRRLAVMLAGAAAFVDLYAPQSILPQLAAHYRIGEHQAGLVITVTTLAVALIAPFAGALSDALGRKRVIVAATLLLTLPTPIGRGEPSFSLLLLLRALSGMLMPLIFCVTVAYISEEWPTEEARAVTGLYMAGAVAGGFAGRFLTGLVTEFTDWRVAFVLLAAVNLTMGLTLLRWMPRERGFRPAAKLTSSLDAMRTHLRDQRLNAACVVGLAILFAQVGLFTYANFLLAGPPFHLGPGLLGSIFAVYLVGMLTTPVGGNLMRRFPEQATLVARSLDVRGRRGADANSVARGHRGRAGARLGGDLPQPVGSHQFRRPARGGGALGCRRSVYDLVLSRRQRRRDRSGHPLVCVRLERGGGAVNRGQPRRRTDRPRLLARGKPGCGR